MEPEGRNDKREQILDAALCVFSRKGVFGTRIADIAGEAGIAYGLVYHYFKNKDEILNTIFEERWVSLAEKLEAAELAGDGAIARLRGVTEVFIEAYEVRPQVVEILLLEFTHMSCLMEPGHLEKVARAFGTVSRVIERGQEEGALRSDVHSSVLMLMFVGGLQMLLQSQLFGFLRPPKELGPRAPHLMLDVFLDGVREK